MRQHPSQNLALEFIPRRALGGALDMLARIIGKVHVIDAAGARRHARVAGQASIEMGAHELGRSLAFEHRFYEVDPPARTVALVPEKQVGGACSGAEAAMHAAPQDLVRFLQARALKLLRRELGFHRCSNSRVHSSWIEDPRRVERMF